MIDFINMNSTVLSNFRLDQERTVESLDYLCRHLFFRPRRFNNEGSYSFDIVPNTKDCLKMAYFDRTPCADWLFAVNELEFWLMVYGLFVFRYQIVVCVCVAVSVRMMTYGIIFFLSTLWQWIPCSWYIGYFTLKRTYSYNTVKYWQDHSTAKIAYVILENLYMFGHVWTMGWDLHTSQTQSDRHEASDTAFHTSPCAQTLVRVWYSSIQPVVCVISCIAGLYLQACRLLLGVSSGLAEYFIICRILKNTSEYGAGAFVARAC